MINRATIDRIFATADIAEVIGDFVKLKRAGVNYKGLSPFTNEKSPSFFVSPSKGIFKCFSSNKGGSVVTFLMEHEKLSYPEALRYLAKKYQIDIVEEEQSPEDQQRKDDRESMLALTLYAQRRFSEFLLNSEEGKAIGLSYFHERGFRDDIIEKFHLGYSPEGRDAFTKATLADGYKTEYLVKTGLTIQKDEYLFDRFHGRVIFPIHSLSGQVLGFGGRILKPAEKAAKYLNSPESEIYHKSNILYGIFFARQSMVKEDKCFLVEGYTDVISMHQAGVTNVVASSGTALTVEQIRLIKRFTRNITVLYDGDEAGIKASLRGIDLILNEGLNVKVVLFPDGEDPDSFARKKSAAEFIDYVAAGEMDFITFKTRLLMKGAESDPIQRATLITDIVRSISMIPESITRTVYIRECSRMLDMEEQVLFSEIRRIRKAEAEKAYKPDSQAPSEGSSLTGTKSVLLQNREPWQAEKDLISFLLKYGNREVMKMQGEGERIVSVSAYILREVENDDLTFNSPIYRYIYQEITRQVKECGLIEKEYFIYHEDVAIASTTVDLLFELKLSKIWEKNDVFVGTEEMNLPEKAPKVLNALKEKYVKALLADAGKQLKSAEEKGDEGMIFLMQQRFIILNQLKKELARNLGDRIIV